MPGDLLRCIQPRFGCDPHGLALLGPLDRQHFCLSILRPAIGGVGQSFGRCQAARRCAQKPRLRARAKRRGQQQRVSARLQMALQQIGEQLLHEAVGGMHLIHHQQMPQQGSAPHMGVAGGNAGQQHLIDRANCDLRRQEAFGVFGRPALRTLQLGGHIIPFETEPRQAVAAHIIGANLARHREHHGRAILDRE